MTGFVYAIASSDLVKIGWSTRPRSRLSKIRTDNHGGCELLGYVPATRAQEKSLHEMLEPWRQRGEWFRREGPVNLLISMLAAPSETVCRRKQGPGNRLRVWRLERGMSLQVFAAKIGVTRVAVSRFERGLRIPCAETMPRITAATAGAVTANDFYAAYAEAADREDAA